jgi:hypothetical protein
MIPSNNLSTPHLLAFGLGRDSQTRGSRLNFLSTFWPMTLKEPAGHFAESPSSQVGAKAFAGGLRRFIPFCKHGDSAPICFFRSL